MRTVVIDAIAPEGIAYLREHGFHTITGNMYASLSEGLEMLFLYAFAFGKHSSAAMVHCATS